MVHEFAWKEEVEKLGLVLFSMLHMYCVCKFEYAMRYEIL